MIVEVAAVTLCTIALSRVTPVRVVLLISHQVEMVEFVIVVTPVVEAVSDAARDGE